MVKRSRTDNMIYNNYRAKIVLKDHKIRINDNRCQNYNCFTCLTA